MNISELNNFIQTSPFLGEFATFEQTDPEHPMVGLFNRQGEVLIHEPDGFITIGKTGMAEYAPDWDFARSRYYNANTRTWINARVMPYSEARQMLYVEGDLQGIMDYDENILLKAEYTKVYYYPHLYMYALKNKEGLWGVVDTEMRQVLPFEYEDIVQACLTMHQANLAEFAVKKDGVYSLVDTKGAQLSLRTYQWLSPYTSSGYALCKLDGTICVINRAEEVVLRTDYTDTTDENGCLTCDWVSPDCLEFLGPDEQYGIMNLQWKVICPLSKRFYPRNNLTNRFRVWGDNELCGMVDGEGRWLIPAEYQYIRYVHYAQCYLADRNGKKGILRLDGTVLLPFEYDHLMVGRQEGLSCVYVYKDGRNYTINALEK